MVEMLRAILGYDFSLIDPENTNTTGNINLIAAKDSLNMNQIEGKWGGLFKE